MKLAKFESVSLKSHSELGEVWVQDRIAEDPSILGLGDLILKDKERLQPRAGRLDLLLQDADSSRRYEVEVQLGSTDESHIIRTVEYWDIERKRYPQYEHTAVIVAEDITSRFLNIISLFNGVIPLVAIQMKCLKIGDQVGLVFTTVLNQMTLGLVDEDEEIQEVTNRAYWTKRSSENIVKMADEIFVLVKQFDASLELKYNKFYIGMAKNGQPYNVVTVRPKKGFIRFEPRLLETTQTQKRIEAAGLKFIDYDARWKRYRINLESGDVAKHRDVLSELIREAFDTHANM